MHDNSLHESDSADDEQKPVSKRLKDAFHMNYTNLDSRLKMTSLSPAFLRRLKRIRKASLKSRATKKQISGGSNEMPAQ